MTAPRILALAGSTRTDSWNKKLIRVAAQSARGAGADVKVIDLRDLELPMYDGDLEAEQGLPPGALELKSLMAEHAGLMIASPEYNSSVSGVLKNAIDWASRKATPDESTLQSFDGKVAGIMSASPGQLGGLRGLVHLRAILSNIRVMVIPQQMAISNAEKAFAEDGALLDPRQQQAIAGIAARLTEVLTKLGR